MDQFRKIWAVIVAIPVIYLMVLILTGAGVLFPSEKKIPGIEEAGLSLSELRIPEDAKVIGIGEATHGNREFQILKRQVLEKVVKEGNGRSIAFEISAGEAAMLNDAIHDTESDLVELLGKQSYPLYDTEEIAELLRWMREYDQSVSFWESLMFYGVDMQGAFTTIAYLQDVCGKEEEYFTEEEREKLLSMDTDDDASYSGERDFFADMGKRLGEKEDLRSRQLAILCNAVVQGLEAPRFEEQPSEYASYRDRCMAENLKRYSELEESRGYSQILITAHNGHVMKGASADDNREDHLTMGENINRLFEGSYFCIGSDFYRGSVNIHTAGTYDEEYERADHEYCSNDPLAYQAQYFEDGQYCLDFSGIGDTESELYRTVHSSVFTGLVGEGYNVLIDIGKSYRIKCIPAERYDAVVYYYELTPIDPIHY